MAVPRQDFISPRSIKNREGYALVLLLAMMPVIMSAMVAYLLLNTALQTWMHSAHICRTELLTTQTTVARDLEQLLKTNSVVKTLRSQILVTQGAIITATAAYQYYIIPPLKKTLMNLQQQERAVGVLQKSLVAAATAKMNSGNLRVQHGIQAQYNKLRPKISEFVSVRLLQIHYLPKRLAVKPDRPSAAAAVYDLENNFKQKQSLSVFWNTEIRILDSEWSKNWFRFWSRKKDSCASTLEQEGERWQSILNEDKSLLKSW